MSHRLPLWSAILPSLLASAFSSGSAPVVSQGRIPLTLPPGHTYVSVVVDDASGQRVRNLVKLGTAEQLGGVTNADGSVAMQTAWDGKDDKGLDVPPGRYTVRGVTVPEVDPHFEYSFYNPGTPPWHGYPLSAWGSNHGDGCVMACVPQGVTSAWRTVVGFNGSEGTDCMIAIGTNDTKVWGFQTGWGDVRAVAADGEFLYHALGNTIRRIRFKDQSVGLFKRTAGGIPEIKTPAAPVVSLALTRTHMVAVLAADANNPKPQMIVFDKESGRTNGPSVTLDAIGNLGVGRNDTLFICDTNGFAAIDLTEARKPIALPGMQKPGAFAFAADKTLYMFDAGPDRQVKVYSPDFSKLLRTVGRKGGQPKPQYDRNAFENLLALAIDDRGYLWTSEGMNPRRQAVWDLGDVANAGVQTGAARDTLALQSRSQASASPMEGETPASRSPVPLIGAKLVREFVGSTLYGNWDGKPHDQDPTLASMKTIILAIDPAQTQRYKVKQYIWSGPKPGAKDFMAMGVSFVLFEVNQLFRSKASGAMQEYYLQNSLCQPVLYLQNAKGDYRPVAGMFMKWLPPALDIYSRAADPLKTIYVWSDLNGDEIIDDAETIALPDAGCAGWSGTLRIGPDLAFYFGAYAIKPTRFTPAGAPIYESSTITKRGGAFSDSTVNPTFTQVGKHWYGGRSDANVISGTHLWLDADGKAVGSFPCVGGGVFGSSQVPMPPKGQPIGELFIAGTVDLGGDQGTVMAIHGNYGQVYFFTEDGILIEDMFKDARDNPAGWGATVERGRSWKDTSMLQECFGAWFGKQDDGKLRYCFGHTSANVVEVNGLDQFKRFTAGDVVIGAEPKNP